MGVTCHFKFSNGQIFEKSEKEKDEINFSSIFYLTQSIQNIFISVCNQYKIINEMVTVLFILCLRNLWLHW